MILTAEEIARKEIVKGELKEGKRATTYDATVGTIINQGQIVENDKFILKPRGIVWVVSAEEFHLPNDVSGLATLRTRWTHDGVLALNVGVIDPGWKGSLATAIVNFGNGDFVIKKGAQFFRILFHSHGAVPNTEGLPPYRSQADYISEIAMRSKAFSNTFLNMEALVDDVSKEILRLPRWAYIIGIAAIFATLLAVFAPLAWSVWSDHYTYKVKVERLQADLNDLRAGTPTAGNACEPPKGFICTPVGN